MRIETHGDVALVRLEAGRGNAIGPVFLDTLAALLAEAAAARAVVLTGQGRVFSAGLDLPALAALSRSDMESFMRRFSDVMLGVFMLPVPVVAAINGHAIAGGCVLALQADLRLAAAGGAKIGLNEVQLGISLPSEVIETLRVQVPAASLVPIAMQGDLVGPDQALALGLVHEVVAPEALEARALDRARWLTAGTREAIAQVKASLRAPAVERARVTQAADLGAWLDSWYTPAARERLSAAVARLSK